ncbi:glycosyltransferase [Alteromonadaceae bacterium M269]|nr:glycosyltransferase [Alteromonadaceae bacterium M269]
MSIIGATILGAHFFMLLLLSFFGLHRISMVFRWYRYRKVRPAVTQTFEELPQVTVQIPLFNEKFVAERIIDACVELDYPTDKLQIQVVDDSTDNTRELVAERVEYYRKKGVNIDHVHRTNRKGFKAGALKDAMEFATGEFIAIFDADFIPSPSTIKDCIHHFTDDSVGMVQMRWEHINRFSSRFTEAQAIILDSHFALEQQVRYASDKLFNFNGTAGVWRTNTIVDSGHWQGDTLTEDLDLSYRAQMKGWKLLYLNDVSCPGELPANMNAFRSQQHRWAKGGIQVMLKMLGDVWRSRFGLGKKLEATFHLANNLSYLVVLVDTILFLIPSIIVREIYDISFMFWLDLPFLLLATGGHMVYLYFGQVALKHSKRRALSHVPGLMLVGIQLAFNNARAGFEALRGQQSEFVRTPKSGERADKEKEQPLTISQQLYQVVLPKSAAVEFLLSLVYCVVLAWAVHNQIWFMTPFLMLLIIGFMTTAITNLRSQLSLNS